MPAIDLILSLVFMVAILAVGLWPGKIRGREAFLISDRKLGGCRTGFTIAASKIGGGLLVTYSTLVFAFGYQALWLFAGYVVGYILFYIFARSLHKEAHAKGYYTLPDFFQTRYGKTAGVIVGIGCAISLTGWIFTNLIAGGDIIAALTKTSSLTATTLMAVTMAVYLVVGGYHSVVKTDILQYFAMMVILIVIVIAMAGIDYSAGESSTESKSMGVGQIINFILLGALFPMGSAELWQRAYSARDRKGLLIGIGIASITFIVLGLALSFICLSLRDIVDAEGNTPAQLGLVRGVASVVGPVLSGLWVIAFLSAILSSADTFIFTTASSLVQDVFERVGLLRAKHRILALRVVIALLCLVGIIGAVAFKSVVTVAFFYAGVTMSLGVVALFAWFTRRLNGSAISIALLAGLIASIAEAISAGVTARTATVNAGVTAAATLIALVVRSLRKKAKLAE